MAQSVCSVVKGPVGWLVLLDGVRVGGVYGSRVEALNAATTAAAFVVEDGGGVQISVPANPAQNNAPDLAVAITLAATVIFYRLHRLRFRRNHFTAATTPR